MDFLRISFVFTLISCLALGDSREEEVAGIIAQALNWQRENGSVTREISKEHKDILFSYSGDDILGGFILALEGGSQDDWWKAGVYWETDVVSMLQFSADLIPDTTFLQAELAREKDPQKFYQLSILSYSFTRARNADFISEHFNFLFRDGRVMKNKGYGSRPCGQMEKVEQIASNT